MEDNILIMFGIICSNCNNVLDVVSSQEEPLYTDKTCECGSIGFYTCKVRIRILTEKPRWEKPFFEEDGHSFYKVKK